MTDRDFEQAAKDLASRISTEVLFGENVGKIIAALAMLLGSALHRTPAEERRAHFDSIVAMLEQEMNDPTGGLETRRQQ